MTEVTPPADNGRSGAFIVRNISRAADRLSDGFGRLRADRWKEPSEPDPLSSPSI